MQKHTLAATARAETEAAARYLGQLCKHFAHKLTVDYDPETKPGEGLIHFPWGACRLPGRLMVALNLRRGHRPKTNWRGYAA